MAITTRERTELRDELVGQGYSWEYVDEWQPKVTLYRHRDLLNPNGDVVSFAGTAVNGLPGNPDYVNRKARLGMRMKEPGRDCECPDCVERFPRSVDNGPDPRVAVDCTDCTFVARAETKTGALAKLRAHAKIH
jgi:hypothetical protein|tara:strand:- start:73 stop:474 length:402 start_codon:yes stop_codon:yes gene_type:complete